MTKFIAVADHLPDQSVTSSPPGAAPVNTASQFAADLQWAIASPSLITTTAVTESRSPVSGADFTHHASSESVLAGHGRYRVGHYFERLIKWHIQQQADWELLHHGQQIRDAGRTVGELDFVFRGGGQVYHVETAVKFYLYLPHRTCGGSQFVGPNSKDNFEAKLLRLMTHQLPLSQIWRPEVTIRQPHVKGIIFYPLNGPCADELPEGMSPDHERGVWFPATQLPDFLARLPNPQQVQFHIHRKPHWLAAPADSTNALTGVQLAQSVVRHFQTNANRPLMISQLDSTRDRTHSIRLFCMPDHWPDCSG